MSELGDRIAAQRRILRIVNKQRWREDLFGLSSKAIDRWMRVNQISGDSELASLVRTAADRVLALASKSQEQVTEEYQRISSDVADLAAAIESIVMRVADAAGATEREE